MNDIKLTPAQGEVMSLFEANQHSTLSTFELRRSGMASPAQTIAQLKAKGALIKTVSRDAVDDSGKLHKRVAHYTFNGWV